VAPVVTVSPSARTCLHHLWQSVAAVAALVVTTILVGAEDGRLGLGAAVAMLTATAAGSALIWRQTQRWGRAVLAETMRGYSTSPIHLGRFWIGTAPDGPWTVGWVEWDFSGVWIVHPDGHVSPPVRPHVLAPGFYRSPRGQGHWELWTGAQWSGWVRTKSPVTSQ
jgi:hypothetical protein